MTASALPVEQEREPDWSALLAAKLSAPFWAAANWDPRLGLVRPPPEHPSLGWARCVVAGCQVEATHGGWCTGCWTRRKASGLPAEEFAANPPMKTSASAKKRLTDELCLVPGCARPQQTMTTRLCNSHHGQCFARLRSLGEAAVARFVRQQDIRPLPSYGSCLVAACLRLACGSNRLCLMHDDRWKAATARAEELDFDRWCWTEGGISLSGMINLRGLPELVVHQVLFGVQRRAERGYKIHWNTWQQIARHLRRTEVTSLLEATVTGLRTDLRTLLQGIQHEVYSATTTWEQEQRGDTWNLGVIGLPGKVDFTGIAQRWLREVAKHWVAEDLPRRTASKTYGISRDHVSSIVRLSDSLRLHRLDGGENPAALGRRDILEYLTRMAHLRQTGQLSSAMHIRTLRQTRLVLSQSRDAGLDSTGECMTGLPGEFMLRRSDLPRDPAQRSWRAIPAEVMLQLDERLPHLEQRTTREMRVAVELLMDTGRRPDEICRLPLQCLERDGDGGYVLVYTDFKRNRIDRRLPIATNTAELIKAQQVRVRARYSDVADSDLVLLPAASRSANGDNSLRATTVTNLHREWIDSLGELLLDDGSRYPASDLVPYAYRHSFAQRHADAGTPVDVLRDLMGHLSTVTTQIYYQVTEKRTRAAVERLAEHQYDGSGQRLWRQAAKMLDRERARMRVGQVAVPFGICVEPSNVQAGGGACPYRLRCLGCGHFRTDASYLPDLRSYLDRLLADRERVLAATDLQDWAKAEAAPSSTEITKVRSLIRKLDDDLGELTDEERRQIEDACSVIRKTRQVVQLGMPAVPAARVDVRAIGRSG